MFCPNCGNQLEENAIFCAHCGKRIDNENAPKQAVAQPTKQFIITRLQKCPNCNQVYEKPKLNTVNIVLLVAGIFLLFVFLPIGILSLYLGLTYKMKEAPCPYCGCSLKEYKEKKRMERRLSSEFYKPEQYTLFYQKIYEYSTRYMLERICLISTQILSLLSIIPLFLEVSLEFELYHYDKEVQLAYADAIYNASEFLGGALLSIVFLNVLLAIFLIVMKDSLWPKLVLVVSNVATLIITFIASERFISEEFMYRFYDPDEFYKVDVETTLGAPKSMLIIFQLLMIVLVVGIYLIQRAKQLEKIARKEESAESI